MDSERQFKNKLRLAYFNLYRLKTEKELKDIQKEVCEKTSNGYGQYYGSTDSELRKEFSKQFSEATIQMETSGAILDWYKNKSDVEMECDKKVADLERQIKPNDFCILC